MKWRMQDRTYALLWASSGSRTNRIRFPVDNLLDRLALAGGNSISFSFTLSSEFDLLAIASSLGAMCLSFPQGKPEPLEVLLMPLETSAEAAVAGHVTAVATTMHGPYHLGRPSSATFEFTFTGSTLAGHARSILLRWADDDSNPERAAAAIATLL